MSPRAASRSLQRGHGHRTPGRVGGGASVAAGEQPFHGKYVVRKGNPVGIAVSRRPVVARREPDVIADGLELGLDGAGPHARRGQQGHGNRMQQGPRLGAHGHDIAEGHHPQLAASQQRMLIDQALRAIQRVGEQHGLQGGITTAGQLAQLLQQPLQPVRIAPQTVEEARIGHSAGIEYTGRRDDRREPVADGMCQSAQQIVMHREPSFGADAGLPGFAH